MTLIECVPNFSEGRRPEVVDEIAAAVAGTPGVTLLDCQSDGHHNRSVLTFVGEAGGIGGARIAACQGRLAGMRVAEKLTAVPAGKTRNSVVVR